MSINVSCQCGASFSVPEQFAGRQTACPKYKQPLTIPAVAPLPATPPPQATTPVPAVPAPPKQNLPGEMPAAPSPFHIDTGATGPAAPQRSPSGDPYLFVLKSDSCFGMDDIDRAKQFLAKAIEANRNMPKAYYSQIDITFLDNDFDSILSTLKRIHDLSIVMDLTAVPEFRPFASSPQFDEYFKYISQ
ncbi:MAG: hypothetical protein CMJ79_15115 [Planctomycetaceae bacterium]|nr:hypothetical protein [Planctomycetaceae bacterium]MBK97023.1 hypothetical protein [Planctomycetaceae bacterium]